MTRSLVLASSLAAVSVLFLNDRPVRGTAIATNRLVSSMQLPEGAECEWSPAFGGMTPRPSYASMDAVQRGRPADGDGGELEDPGVGRGIGACRADGCAAAAAREPVRFIQDPNAGFSAVRLDVAHDEVVLMDEFHFNAYVYDRLAETPPSAIRTEPKRTIGGRNTKSQFNSDAYVDPASGDIYVINNDSEVGLNVFSRQAHGNAAPDRGLHTPYGGFGIAVDEVNQELFVTVQHDGAIVTWPKSAHGEDRPIRLLQGARTHMADPHGVAFDPKNKLLFVANYGTSRQTQQGNLGVGGGAGPRIPNWPAGNLWPFVSEGFRHEIVDGTGAFGPPSIAVFRSDAHGNTPPLRIIEGPKAQLNWPTGIAVDSERGEVYVTNAAGDAVNVFSATAQGDAAPIRILKGACTSLKNPTGVVVDVQHDEVWVANFGNHMATVYKRTAAGDTAPLRVIRSAPIGAPTTMISNPYSVAFDVTRDQILVPNCVAQPRIAAYSALADKNAAPERILEGQKTRLNRTVHSIAYDSIHDEIVVNQNIGQAILTFRGSAKGEDAPIRTIQGPRTLMHDPQVTFTDPVNNEIYVINMTIDDEILVFDRLAQGDVAPKRVLKGPDTMLGAEYGAVDPIHNLLIVTGREEARGGREGRILIFDRTASGNAKPLRVIGGPKSGLGRAGKMTIYPPTGRILVGTGSGVGVWRVTDDGDVPPEWRIVTPGGGLAIDPKNQSVIVSNKPLNAVLSYRLPEMF